MSALSAFITALSGPELLADERALLRAARPCGVILFARNIVAPAQVRRLTSGIRDAVGSEHLMLLVDQEGGRVQRLGPPHWRALPPGAQYAAAYAHDPARAVHAAELVARLMAHDLREAGFNTDCAPVLDLPVSGSHAVIGDRAFGETPGQVVALAGAVVRGFAAGGILPVIKHIPGHGRATSDSHHDLPVVDTPRAALTVTDFAPFAALAHVPAAMTAHVVFSSIDPALPASVSPAVTADVIRGAIGYQGLLMSDDLGMKALSGTIAQKAAAVFRAGSDVALLCSGELGETEAVAAVAPPLEGEPLRRLERASAVFRQQPRPFDVREAEAALAEICKARPESV
ncbi:MAG: beta-N-acetylhexosaminidase [Hyphomicrobiaceae bacterium]|nr:beta-N-acetylhexosaminidase [Hyphomicrobiaceae bacterium]